MNKLKEQYGPFRDRDTYERAKSKWNNSAKENNDSYYEDFKDDITEAVSQVVADYYMSHGCRYLGSQVIDILKDAFDSLEDPFTFADLIDSEDDFHEHNYYEEKAKSRKEHVRESYGPYGSKDEYDSDLRDYKAAADEANIKHAHDFSYDLLCLFENNFFDEDFPEKISELYFYYEAQFGCRYDREEIEEYIQKGEDLIKMGERNIKELEKFFESPDPWEFKDMVDNDDTLRGGLNESISKTRKVSVKDILQRI